MYISSELRTNFFTGEQVDGIAASSNNNVIVTKQYLR